MNNKILSIIVVVLTIVVGALAFGYWNLSQTKTTEENTEDIEQAQTANVKGFMNFHGVELSDEDEATIHLAYREHGSGEFEYADIEVPTNPNEEWDWPNGVPGVTYDVKALLEINDKIVAETEEVTFTAPAEEAILHFDLTNDMFPTKEIETTVASIGGTTQVNGYIPANSLVKVYAKKTIDQSGIFTEVVSTPLTAHSTNWVWDGAEYGELYDLKSIAVDSSGTTFAESIVGQRAAPSSNVMFIVTSHATAPNTGSSTNTNTPEAQNATISGKVKINGIYEDGSMIDIHIKETDESNYETVDRVDAKSGATWEWNNAKVGVAYKIKAVVDQPNEDDISGNSVTTKAPAKEIALKVDTHHYLDEPDSKPSLVSCEDEDDGEQKAKLRYPDVEDAERYLITVGSNKHDNNVYSNILKALPNNDDIEITVEVDDNDNYYTEYAYSTCSDCGGKSSFSDFSDYLEFECDTSDN